MKHTEEFSGKKVRRMDQQAEKKDKTWRVTGFSRGTREETIKWNQMTALRFQTGWRHHTSPATLQGKGNEQGDCTHEQIKGESVINVCNCIKLPKIFYHTEEEEKSSQKQHPAGCINTIPSRRQVHNFIIKGFLFTKHRRSTSLTTSWS